MMPLLVLASASQRRLELLKQIHVVPDKVVSADIDETPLSKESPKDCVKRLATEKAKAVFALHPHAVVLAADTIIVFDNKIMGKPSSFDHAVSIWQQISGAEHKVLTAVSLISAKGCETLLSESAVAFTQIPESQFQSYWLSQEPQDKAGAYAIQGFSAAWIKSINGSYSGIMGLPLCETAQLLQQHGIQVLP